MTDDNIIDFEQFQKKIKELEEQLNQQREQAEQRAKAENPNVNEQQRAAFKKMLEAYQAFLPSKEELSDLMGTMADAFQQAADQARAAQDIAKGDKGGEEE
tara:strand:- start:288 stop:590 length:303 start_codon:yes stop_codon:yes gene_type:complete